MKSPEEFKRILKQLPGISISTCFYRFMEIGYLKDPLSGLGSLEHGGRYNFKGKGSYEVVYLAPDPETAIAEGSRDKYLISPSVLITIEVNLQKVIDLEDSKNISALGINEQELYCSWRKIQDVDGKEAYTQIFGRMMYESQVIETIRYPSVVKKGRYNLAIFINRLKKDSELKVHDPDKKISRVIKGPVANLKRIGY